MARKKRALQEINAGTMADIAFLLLVFFLVTTTMDTDVGVTRVLPPPLPDNVEKPPPIKDRNVLEVLVNTNDQLLVENEYANISELKDITKRFIENPMGSDDLPEKKAEEVPFFGSIKISKQVISLQNDKGTSYDMYIQVQNELARAYNELRNELSMQQFGESFDKLVERGEDEKVKAIRKIYPQRISEAEPKDVGKN